MMKTTMSLKHSSTASSITSPTTLAPPSSTASSTTSFPDCPPPPSVETLGTHTWNLLHSTSCTPFQQPTPVPPHPNNNPRCAPSSPSSRNNILAGYAPRTFKPEWKRRGMSHMSKGGKGWETECVRRIMRLIGSWGRGCLIVERGGKGGHLPQRYRTTFKENTA